MTETPLLKPAPALDPDAAQLLEAMRAAGIPRFETLSPAGARQLLADLRARAGIVPPPVVEARDLAAPGPDGQVRLRLYRSSATDAPTPCLVYLHGGGFVLGNLETHDVLSRTLANLTGCTVIAVDYRLAPESKFPAGLEDASTALRFIAREAANLRLDKGRIALGGDSAGGNLAAVMALMSRDGDLPPIALQFLFYPTLDLTLDRPSQALDMDGLPLTGPTMVWFRDHYLGALEERTDWRASPLLAPSLAGVAPCYLITAGVDPLCDDGLAFAARLAAEGVRVTHSHFPGQLHGFLTAAIGSPTAVKALEAFALAIRQEFGLPAARV